MAADALLNKRADWGYHRQWEGNYLAKPSENPQSSTFVDALRSLKQKENVQEVCLLF